MSYQHLFFVVEETMEELLQEGLIRDALSEVMANTLKETQRHRSFDNDKPKELVKVDFKIGRHKPKPSDEYSLKFKLQ
jgi:CRP-like cAMP-binding protein